jgi:imidazolonepropionase-like amidohydrolase
MTTRKNNDAVAMYSFSLWDRAGSLGTRRGEVRVSCNALRALVAILATMLPSTWAWGESFVIRNVRVFDGRRVIDDADVSVKGDKITAVGKHLDVASDARVIDGSGATLLPGLIDAHTHTFGDALKDAIAFGVTTELDMFTDIKYVQQVKRLEAQGKNRNAADLRSAGTLATVRGGHGTEYGFSIPTLSTPAEAKGWVNARVKEGSDYIKIVYDDGREYGFERPTLSKETMKSVIDAAHEQHKLAVEHIGTQQQARDAIEAGADGLAHLFTVSAPRPDFAALVAAHHVFVVPTLTVLEGVSGRPSGESLTKDLRLEPFLTRANIDNLKKAFPKFSTPLDEKYAEAAVRDLKAAGVSILTGTDAPNPGTAHGASLHRELELLVRSGMTPVEALTSATSVPAATFNLDDRGTIAAGKRADLVLVKGDPTNDIKATRSIVAVWKAGVPVDRDAYRNKIAQANAAAKKAQVANPLVAAGLISDFEDNQPSAKFGAGWTISTDSLIGGKSTAEMKPTAGGANGSKFSLKVNGKIDGRLPFAWAGIMFSPGTQVFAPANLSAKKNLTFWAKGDGKTYRVMLFTQSGGRIPAQQTFSSEKDWKQFKLPLSSFNGTDGHDVTAILFVGGPTPGAFEFTLDNVELQ